MFQRYYFLKIYSFFERFQTFQSNDLSKGTSINEVPRFLAIFYIPSYFVLLYNVQFLGLPWTLLPTLISDVINGRSLMFHLLRRWLNLSKFFTLAPNQKMFQNTFLNLKFLMEKLSEIQPPLRFEFIYNNFFCCQPDGECFQIRNSKMQNLIKSESVFPYNPSCLNLCKINNWLS